MEVMHSSLQDMDLIDILWRQDIDLGAQREVFDYNHRQKEHELQRQRQLEEEKQLQLLREQEKALLAQLQLDEETGEYVPRRPPSVSLQPAAAPLEVSQNVGFTEDDRNDLSFDECLQLLAERFPVDESEDLNVTVSPTMMSPEQPPLQAPSLVTGPVPSQKMSPDLEQALMEILSLPELQQCLNMQMDDNLETTIYPVPNSPELSPELPEPQYSFYPLPDLAASADVNTAAVHPDEFLNVFSGTFPSVAPPENLSQMNTASEANGDFGTESLCGMFYPTSFLGTEASGGSHRSFDENQSQTVTEIKPVFTQMDFYSLSPGDAFNRHTEKAPDSDSGVSFSTSPHSSSPDKSVYGDGSYGFSDSEPEEMEQDGTESDYAEMFSLNFQPDDLHFTSSSSPSLGQEQEKKPGYDKTEAVENCGNDGVPFTKDKQKKRSEGRLTRDEQKAKALQIPFTVDTIINLPVDDFNAIMSKHQLNDSQLALVRDIRRRGKNKVAAQNCRKRKMENIVGLEVDLDSLKEEKERLVMEKKQNITNLREMKAQLSSLYLEVFNMLRDEKGNTYSPSEYSLQQSADGTIFLVPRIKKT